MCLCQLSFIIDAGNVIFRTLNWGNQTHEGLRKPLGRVMKHPAASIWTLGQLTRSEEAGPAAAVRRLWISGLYTSGHEVWYLTGLTPVVLLLWARLLGDRASNSVCNCCRAEWSVPFRSLLGCAMVEPYILTRVVAISSRWCGVVTMWHLHIGLSHQSLMFDLHLHHLHHHIFIPNNELRTEMAGWTNELRHMTSMVDKIYFKRHLIGSVH